MRFMLNLLTTLALAAVSMPGGAQDGVGPADSDTAGRWFVSLGGGNFKPDTGGEIGGRSGQSALALDLGYAYNEYLSAALDISDSVQRYDTPSNIVPPLLGTINGRIGLGTSGLSIVGKAGYPLGAFRPYVGAGVGLFFSEARLSGSILGGLPASREEKDSGLGELLLLGADLRLSNTWLLGVEYRQIFLKGDFGDLSNGEVDLGGSSVMAVLRGLTPRR